MSKEFPLSAAVKGLFIVGLLSLGVAGATLAKSGGAVKKGDTLQTLTNLHPDMRNHEIVTLNYQWAAIIPTCSSVTVAKISSKKLTFEYKGQLYEFMQESHTENAGVSFQKAMRAFFGKACDNEKLQSLSELDKEGVREGRPKVGMTREGILFAMGRPPFHANPTLTGPAWIYWRNRFSSMQLIFDADGKVMSIK